jgi:hypothetical protein
VVVVVVVVVAVVKVAAASAMMAVCGDGTAAAVQRKRLLDTPAQERLLLQTSFHWLDHLDLSRAHGCVVEAQSNETPNAEARHQCCHRRCKRDHDHEHR